VPENVPVARMCGGKEGPTPLARIRKREGARRGSGGSSAHQAARGGDTEAGKKRDRRNHRRRATAGEGEEDGGDGLGPLGFDSLRTSDELDEAHLLEVAG
jgi:hypothetical protein